MLLTQTHQTRNSQKWDYDVALRMNPATALQPARNRSWEQRWWTSLQMASMPYFWAWGSRWVRPGFSAVHFHKHPRSSRDVAKATCSRYAGNLTVSGTDSLESFISRLLSQFYGILSCVRVAVRGHHTRSKHRACLRVNLHVPKLNAP